MWPMVGGGGFPGGRDEAHIAVLTMVYVCLCVSGHPEYVAGVIDVMGLVTERHTAPWIASQGGWVSTSIKFFTYNNEDLMCISPPFIFHPLFL